MPANKMISGSIYKNKNNNEVIWINIFGRRVTILSKTNKIYPFEEDKEPNMSNASFESKKQKLTSSFCYKDKSSIFDKLFTNNNEEKDEFAEIPQLIRRKTFSLSLNKLMHKEIKENSNNETFKLDLIDNFIKEKHNDLQTEERNEDNEINNFKIWNRRDITMGSMYNDIMGFTHENNFNYMQGDEEDKIEELKQTDKSYSENLEQNRFSSEYKTNVPENISLNNETLLIDHGVMITAIQSKSISKSISK